MVNSVSLKQAIKSIPSSVKIGDFPLDKINTKLLEGVQRGIPLFDGKNRISIKDISFISKRFETLNLFRGCNVGCTHCLKNALPFNKKENSILFEDLKRFTDGFKTLSERLSFNTLNGNSYINVIDDSNPIDAPIKGLTCTHDLSEAINIIYNSLRIPVLIVTSGWSKDNKFAQQSAEKINKNYLQNKQMLKSIDVSINPFSNIMEKSRDALNSGDKDKADSLRNEYTDRIANTLLTFWDMFKGKKPKGNIIYRHANNNFGNELVNEFETKNLYTEIYNKLHDVLGDKILEAPALLPEKVTKFDKSHLIEPTGRARKYFPYTYNMRVQSELISEYQAWNQMGKAEQYNFLKDYSIKSIDINGKVYSVFPAIQVKSENSPIELLKYTDIQLNYLNNIDVKPVYSDIEL